MKSAARLAVSIKRSSRLLVIQSMAHVAAVGAVLASNIPSWLMAFLLLLIGASLARFRRTLPITGLVLHSDGRIETVGADGVASDAAVHPHTLILSFLIVLLYRQHGRLRSIALLGDSLAAEDFRHLRLWLRWRSTATGPG